MSAVLVRFLKVKSCLSRVTESSIEPLKAQLIELDSSISDQLDLIAAVKANIIRNDDKTEKMLSSITKS